MLFRSRRREKRKGGEERKRRKRWKGREEEEGRGRGKERRRAEHRRRGEDRRTRMRRAEQSKAKQSRAQEERRRGEEKREAKKRGKEKPRRARAESLTTTEVGRAVQTTLRFLYDVELTGKRHGGSLQNASLACNINMALVNKTLFSLARVTQCRQL